MTITSEKNVLYLSDANYILRREGGSKFKLATTVWLSFTNYHAKYLTNCTTETWSQLFKLKMNN